MADEDEVLAGGRAPLRRGHLLAALVVAALALAAFLVVRWWPDGSSTTSAAPSPSGESPNSQPPSRQPWPTRPAACGESAELPLVSSAPASEPTDLEVTIGGTGLKTVDFDTGRTTTVPTGLRRHEIIAGLPAETVAATQPCDATDTAVRPRMLSIRPDGSISSSPLPRRVQAVFGDGRRAWGVSFPQLQGSRGFLMPLDGGRRVWLPREFWPVGITDGLVVGQSGGMHSSVVIVDAKTGRVRADDLGEGTVLAVGSGVVIWSIGCDVDARGPCDLLRRPVRGGVTYSSQLRHPLGFTLGVLSRDGWQVAFTLDRANLDERYDEGHPFPPVDVALLNLRTGDVDTVPGVELPAKVSPGLAFSPDGRWLVMALDAGTRTRLLAWHAGLSRPYESRPVRGLGWSPTPLIVRTRSTAG